MSSHETVRAILSGGQIVSTRTDSDGLKINLRGKGFFIWVNAESPDVRIERTGRPHMSLLCWLQQDRDHIPCHSRTCDGHGSGEYCGLPCECYCHV